jgi:hypothetical protein
MSVKPFDIERVKLNWDRVAVAPVEQLPARLQAVAPPQDPLPEAERLLMRITQLARTQFAAQLVSLTPFLNEARDLLEQMQQAEASHSDSKPMRKKFLSTLDDLQDLFEVYAGIGLR